MMVWHLSAAFSFGFSFERKREVFSFKTLQTENGPILMGTSDWSKVDRAFSFSFSTNRKDRPYIKLMKTT